MKRLLRRFPRPEPARLAAFAALAALAAGSAWVAWELQPTPGAGAARDHEPDFYLEEFDTTVMGTDGKPTRRVAGEYMAHFPDTDTKELSRPRITLYRDAGAPWLIESERGWVSAGDDVMLLLGKVRIWRNGPDGGPEIEIETKDLRVLPDSDYGETDRPVVIRTATSESHGVGMRAYLAQNRMELLSDVRTRYEKHTH